MPESTSSSAKPLPQLSLFEADPVPSHNAASASKEHFWDYCPNCGARLYNIGCKYRCSKCHYFMSCSDFD